MLDCSLEKKRALISVCLIIVIVNLLYIFAYHCNVVSVDTNIFGSGVCYVTYIYIYWSFGLNVGFWLQR